jgi:UPF0755 protein
MISIRRLAACTLGAALVAMLAAGIMLARESDRVLHTPLALPAPVLFTIAPGMNLGQVARALEAEGWVRHHRLFELHAHLVGRARAIRAGTYEIHPGDTAAGLLARFAAGDTKVFAVTFIEGSTFRDFRRVLARQPYVRRTIQTLPDAEVMLMLGVPERSPEGSFFPSTYHYEAGTTDLALLERARLRMDAVVAAAWERRAPDLPYTDPYEAVIMASIIEKETGRAEERREIAGVFVRRLARGMKLQTDPTVIYGLGAEFDGNLRSADLVRDTPYNTYVRHGLPPTPIAMPGKDAIEAALDPAPGESLYFVAKGDGSHHFSASLREHTLAVRQYQLGRPR